MGKGERVGDGKISAAYTFIIEV